MPLSDDRDEVIPTRLRLRRINPVRDTRRFYLTPVKLDLFGGGSLIREWGQIGSSGQTLVEHEADEGSGDHIALKDGPNEGAPRARQPTVRVRSRMKNLLQDIVRERIPCALSKSCKCSRFMVLISKHGMAHGVVTRFSARLISMTSWWSSRRTTA